jgi:WD40 repeat protein
MAIDLVSRSVQLSIAVAVVALIGAIFTTDVFAQTDEVHVVPNLPHFDRGLLLATSHDGTQVLSGGDNTLKLWNMQTGQLLRTFVAGEFKIRAVAFSQDGKHVIAGSGTGITRWDAVSGQLDYQIKAESENPSQYVRTWFSPDSALVLSQNNDFVLQLWDAATGQQTRRLQTEGRYIGVEQIAFSPGNAHLLLYGLEFVDGGHIFEFSLWDASTGRLIRKLSNEDLVMSLAFSPDGRSIAIGNYSGTIELRGLEEPVRPRMLSGHSEPVVSLRFSPDGRRLVSGSDDNTMRLWEVDNGRHVRTFEGHKSNVVAVAFARNENHVLSGSDLVRLWDADSGRLIRSFSRKSSSLATKVAFSTDNTIILSMHEDGSLKVWDAYSGALLRSNRGPQNSRVVHWATEDDRTLGGGLDQHLVSFSPVDQNILTARNGSGFDLWDTVTGELIREFDDDQKISAVTFSPNGERILSTGGRRLALWDTASGQRIRTFDGHDYGVDAVAFSPSGRHIISASADSTIRLWDVDTGAVVTILEHSTLLTFQSAVFSPDGNRILSSKFGGHPPTLWDATTGAVLRSYEAYPVKPPLGYVSVVSMDQVMETLGNDGGGVEVLSLSFSPDGKMVATGNGDAAIRIFNTSTGELLRTLEGHLGPIVSVAFSQDSQRIVSASHDGSIRIWDVRPERIANADTGSLLATLIASAADTDEWVNITPRGFFAGSSQGAELLSVVRGLKDYDVRQIYQSLFEPNLVREQLTYDPDGEVREAAKLLDLAGVLDSGTAPQVTFVAPADGAESVDEVIEAQVRIADAGGGIGRIEWRVNGVTVRVTRADGTKRELIATESLALELGKNTIEVVAYNRRNLISSLPAATSIVWADSSAQPDPKLFVIAVGIDEYRDSVFSELSYAVADARAFGAAMEAAGRGLYSDVEVHYVTEGVSIERLERAIDTIGAKSNPRDSFVFFAAAHGKSEHGRFHLIPQDYRSVAGRPISESSIGQDRLQDWFANRIKARRGLILLDTCESGALVTRRPSHVDAAHSDAAIGRLNEATGRPVLTAAASDEAALEDYDGHGVFTYALLDALVNGDTNYNGLIELRELAAHIQTLAPQLSGELRTGLAVIPQSSARGMFVPDEGPIAPRFSNLRQRPQLGSRGEDFALVKRLDTLPIR